MRLTVKIISSVIAIHSIIILIRIVIGDYITYKYLLEINDYQFVIGYPLFLHLAHLVSMLLGIISAIGLYRLKRWGRKYLNLLIAISILIHMFQVIDKFFPDMLGYILIEHSSGAIFYTSKFQWHSIFIMFVAIGIFLIINSNECKKIFEP